MERLCPQVGLPILTVVRASGRLKLVRHCEGTRAELPTYRTASAAGWRLTYLKGRTMRRFCRCPWLPLWLLFLVAAASPRCVYGDEAALEFFEREVRPILVKRCYECHSGNARRLEGGLRLDSRAASLKGGDTGPAVVPGKLKESLLIDAINYGETYQMPPKSKLPVEEIAVLTKWVEQGAVWPNESAAGGAGEAKKFDLAKRKASHWSWKPIQATSPPAVKNEAWIQQPLDRFILAKLEASNFAPARPADAATLIRRMYFDVIGLPPSEAEVKAFVAAHAEDKRAAIEQTIDKLLASPHFGERWGRHWLDLVRYAESRGHEFDYSAPNAYQYRDYVIRALNADVPYDQFVVEHVAGDLLEKPRLHPTEKFNESILGTGFWFLGEWVHSPVDIRKEETDRFDNMVDVFSKTFLGLTVSCARCHDHKFDAISQKDYYALCGYLQSSGHRLVRFETLEQERQLVAELAKLDGDYRLRFGKSLAMKALPQLNKLGGYFGAAATIIAGGESAKLVAERELEPAILDAWVKRLRQAKDQPQDALHVWGLLAAAKPEEQAAILAGQREQWLQGRAGEGQGGSKVVVDYARLRPGEWMSDGPTFGLRPQKAGELLLDFQAAQPVVGVALEGAARRDPTWNGLKAAAGSELEAGRLSYLRAGKTLRTPTFDIEQGLVHCLIKGAATIYAAVDSHSLINGPLHGQLMRETGGDANAPLRWFTLDLKAYVGHRAHLEITPKDDLPFELVRVVTGEKPAPLPTNPHAESLLAAWEGDKRSPGRALENAFARTFEEFCRSGIAQWPSFGHIVVTEPALFGVDASSMLPRAAEYRQAREAITGRIRRESKLALAMWDGSGEDDRLLIRGSVKTPGPVVPRRMLEAIGGAEGGRDEETKGQRGETKGLRDEGTKGDGANGRAGQGSGRLEMARRLVDSSNPFVARVMVNRVWHHLLGRGIVPSTDNFGVLGQEPTHPELLDWLARDFMAGEREQPWSLKRLLKSVLLSSAYQQSSDLAEAAVEERDPNNQLWRRQQVKRLEGEAIRDALLAISGRLDRTQFGPSVPIHLTGFLQGRGRPADGPLDGNGRRSIYLSIRRNFLSPMMLAFDTPIPFSTVGRRNVSNVPAQALILMNDPFVLEQMKLWARRAVADPSLKPQQRIARMYYAAYGRAPSEGEVSAALNFLAEQGQEYGLVENAALDDARPWADLGHVLVNGKEFVFVR